MTMRFTICLTMYQCSEIHLVYLGVWLWRRFKWVVTAVPACFISVRVFEMAVGTPKLNSFLDTTTFCWSGRCFINVFSVRAFISRLNNCSYVVESTSDLNWSEDRFPKICVGLKSILQWCLNVLECEILLIYSDMPFLSKNARASATVTIFSASSSDISRSLSWSFTNY